MSTKIRLTKSFHIEMAHALKGYDGKCRFVHGHTFGLEVTVRGEIMDQEGHAKTGMVMDFGDLKKIVNTHIVDVFDHAFVLHRNSHFVIPDEAKEMFGNIIYVDFQPTSEQMAVYFAKILQKQLAHNIELIRLMLRETPSSYAEWIKDDN
jgi:6-pyruvoyltetrahydropterin/6-carboxytetrahydropterin synthase